MKNIKKTIKIAGGTLCGLLNGLFGSGGGVVAVPILETFGLDAKKSHATSVAVIFFLSVLSVITYGIRGNLDFTAAMLYVPWGIIGACTGSFWLKNVKNSLLRRIFGIIVIISAVRLILK